MKFCKVENKFLGTINRVSFKNIYVHCTLISLQDYIYITVWADGIEICLNFGYLVYYTAKYIKNVHTYIPENKIN